MLGLLIIIIISWVLLHFIEKKNIDALGIIPKKNRIIHFLIGFLFIILVVLLNVFIETIVLKINWKLNDINYTNIFNAFIYHLKSALTEDLVFRGAILYILIQRIGAKKAILLSALIFGVYHVFSYGMIGERIILITYVIVITGFVGYVWAYTFHKTKSILMGLGFHVGVNLMNAFFFESQPYGELIFMQISKTDISSWNNFLFLIFKGLFPSILTLLFVKLLFRSKATFLQEKKKDAL